MANIELLNLIKNSERHLKEVFEDIERFKIWEGYKNFVINEKITVSFTGIKSTSNIDILKTFITKYSYFLKTVYESILNVEYNNFFFMFVRVITEYFAYFHFIHSNINDLNKFDWKCFPEDTSISRVNDQKKKRNFLNIGNVTDYLYKIDNQLSNNFAATSKYIHPTVNFEDMADPSGIKTSVSFTSFFQTFFTTAKMNSLLISKIMIKISQNSNIQERSENVRK